MPKKWNSNQMYFDILKDFITKIKNNGKVKISLEDGIYTLKAALALKKSLRESKKILI